MNDQAGATAYRPYAVRAVHCSHEAGDEEVYRALQRATAPLERSWERLQRARRIVVKFNHAFRPEKLVYCGRHLQELTSESVARATLRLLRERTRAEIVCCEISVFKKPEDPSPEHTMTLLPLLREFGVTLIDGDLPPHRVYQVPGGGSMFRQYLLPEGALEDGDAFVSVQKMKSHAFMGVTLCLKNLFGLPPREPYGRSRSYFHHIIRLPYVLTDLGQLFNPALNIVDALVAQSGREWAGEPRIGDTLVAGDQVVATDACAARLMGQDPAGDWPEAPFHRDRNALRVAGEAGFGTANLDEIDFCSEVDGPVAEFSTVETDPQSRVLSWRRTTCEQALYYRDHRQQFVDQYAGEYILLQDREVRWHGKSSELGHSRRVLAGAGSESGMWFKLVDPEEAEGERFEVYEWALRALAP
jgi:uncharacterized protein (DUF362 family)